MCYINYFRFLSKLFDFVAKITHTKSQNNLGETGSTGQSDADPTITHPCFKNSVQGLILGGLTMQE